MSGKRNCAWVVIVPDDDSTEKALLSGEMLRKTRSAVDALAFVSSAVSKNCISRLHEIFPMVVCSDVGVLVNEEEPKMEAMEWDMLVSAMRLTAFSKVVVLAPGVLVLRQSDHLFDVEAGEMVNRIFMMDKLGEEWKVVRLCPDSGRYKEAVTEVATVSEGRMKRERIIGSLYFDGKPIPNGTQVNCELWNRWGNLNDWSLSSNGIVYVDGEFTKGLLEDKSSIGNIAEMSASTSDDTSDWIAIVGMACRLPQANSPEEYWDILVNEKNTSSFPPTHRMSLVDMKPDMKANFLKCPIDQFDAQFFEMSAKEACLTDAQARLLMEVSWEAFEDAGINPHSLRGSSTGVFYGSWLQDYKEELNNRDVPTPSEGTFRKYFRNGFGPTGAKLSFFYGFTGPNISTESACSSSLVAVDLAVKSLQRRECPMALACGANLILKMSKQTKLWAEDGRSKAFDACADGYARAEGVAVIIMKRYSDAIRDYDNIHGIIRGSGVTQDGLTKNFGAPTVPCESFAISSALHAAKVSPSQVDYVEAHAAGTQVGDLIEAAAIVKAYSSGGTLRKEPLWIASSKTNIGHTESTSGVAGIIKVILAMRNELIPKQLNVTRIHPQIDFSQIPGSIPFSTVPWSRKAHRPRIAGVSSFGITGTNVHVILQEPPKQKELSSLEKACARNGYLLTLSAKSDAALDQLIHLFQVHLETSEDTIEHITFSTNVCRPHHSSRKAVFAKDKNEMLAKFQSKEFLSVSKQQTGNICFTFPGRMADVDLTPFRHLFETVPYFSKTMNDCNSVFKEVTNNRMSFLSHLYTTRDENAMTLENHVEWYALFTICQYSLAKLWIHWGVHPDSLLGHCFGEFSALLVSGGLSVENYFKAIQVIPLYLQDMKRFPGVMMALQASQDFTQELINNFLKNQQKSFWIDIACINAADQTAVVAPAEVMKHFQIFCKGFNIRCKLIPIDIMGHARCYGQYGDFEPETRLEY